VQEASRVVTRRGFLRTRLPLADWSIERAPEIDACLRALAAACLALGIGVHHVRDQERDD
jgi:hypothetical protein